MEAKYNKYYSRDFPLDDIIRWVTYGGLDDLNKKRELAIYFGDESNFWRHICPLKIKDVFANVKDITRMEIGPVYSGTLERGKEGKGGAEKRELIFDLDMDDFSEIRNCCEGANICEKCWVYMYSGIKILNYVLTEKFGFKNIMFVFSGRRGVHVWVSDKKAFSLNPRIRSNILDYITIPLNKDDRIENLYPIEKELLEICSKIFIKKKIHVLQGLFDDNTKNSKKVKDLLKGGGNMYEDIQNLLKKYDNDWKYVENYINKEERRKNRYKKLMFTFTIPRLDVRVTKGIDHLLKSPFSIHPKSGLISVPMSKDKWGELPTNWAPSIDNYTSSGKEAFDNALSLFRTFIDKSIEGFSE